LLPSMRNSEVVSSVVEGAEAAAHEFGYTLLIGHTRGDRRTEAQYIQNLVDRRVDGIICYTAVALGRDRDRLLRNGVPLLVLSPPTTNDLFPEATLSFGQATEEAIDHLHGLGHCRIGMITHASASDLDVSVGWGVGFIRRTLDLRGFDTDRRFHVAAQSTVECARLVRDLLVQRRPPTALLVTPLYLVPATIAGIRSVGSRIPHDLSVIGFGDSEWGRGTRSAAERRRGRPGRLSQRRDPPPHRLHRRGRQRHVRAGTARPLHSPRVSRIRSRRNDRDVSRAANLR
jgi:LacI family transcriptional regulator